MLTQANMACVRMLALLVLVLPSTVYSGKRTAAYHTCKGIGACSMVNIHTSREIGSVKVGGAAGLKTENAQLLHTAAVALRLYVYALSLHTSRKLNLRSDRLISLKTSLLAM